MSEHSCVIGLDLGTSGARAVVVDARHRVIAQKSVSYAALGVEPTLPASWWQAAKTALAAVLSAVPARQIAGVCVDGTSGTVLSVDAAGVPLGPALMYNAPCPDAEIVERINAHAPSDSPARGANSALARAVYLRQKESFKLLHQADWIAWHLSGIFASDANNALKTGFDAQGRTWPEWIQGAGMPLDLLPQVYDPGSCIGPAIGPAAQNLGLLNHTMVIAGTTDGCASFLATGAKDVGDGVSALGSTLTIKLLCDRPISAPQYGVYSHWILDKWLVGGASNTGGAVLAEFFTKDELMRLSTQIDPEGHSGLDYYPLLKPGERFPVNDPDLEPRLTPRPSDAKAFLFGMLEGIAQVEKTAYDLLAHLGAPALRRVFSVGGGADNPVWDRIRTRKLSVPFEAPMSVDAAFGAALLAWRGVRR